MYIIEKSVDRKWHYQCRTKNKEEAVKYIKLYAEDQVLNFKSCDCMRALVEETGEVVAMYPKDFVELD